MKKKAIVTDIKRCSAYTNGCPAFQSGVERLGLNMHVPKEKKPWFKKSKMHGDLPSWVLW